MGKSMQGSLVLITGASAGIGLAAARAFVAEGARVVGVARDAERLDQLCADLGGSDRFVPLSADVTDAESMQSMVRKMLDEVGLPDVVVANAGIGLDATFVNTSEETLRKIFEVNFFGLVRTVQPFLPAMIERGSGRVLLISSVVGKRGLPNYSAYCASKFALHGLADALHPELHGTGVSLGIVCPSSTATEFHDRQIRQGPRQRRVRPLRHSAEKVARAIVRMAKGRRREMLLSPEGRFMVFVDTFAPRFVDRILARMFKSRTETKSG